MKERRISVAAGILATATALATLTGCSSTTTEPTGINGTFTGEGQGFGGTVTAELTFENDAITNVVLTGDSETASIGGVALEELTTQIMDAQSAEIDGVSGATLTSNGIKEAVENAIAAANGETASNDAELAFTAGTYTGTGTGYNGAVTLNVTFSENAIESIEVAESRETAHVGDIAFDIMFEDAIAATGSGIDTVSGATFSSRAVKEALNDAAEQAGATNMDAFKSNTVVHEAGDPIEETYDVVIVGAGGAGMAAAAQAVQNGMSVVVLEENAEIGGNTLVSGGAFQSVMPYLVWDANDPEATEGTWAYNGETYEKVKATQGQLTVLKTILNWSEEAFDGNYFADNNIDYVAGDIATLSEAGVHAEYLPTLQALKSEIQAYVNYADAKIAAGAAESDLTLFSTVNLHIFQTYYGGLRQSADGSTWIYGDYDLVSQFIEEAQGMKEWLEDQGGVFDDASQTTLIGALWYRENGKVGADLDGDGELEATGNWGAYFVSLENTINSVDGNVIMRRTTAENLIIEDGKVTGITGTQYDGTEVTLHANEGVILATGGYAANIEMVVSENGYWNSEYLTNALKTTNRSSLDGSGIELGEQAGADTTGLDFTQLMPISWVDNGNLAGGGGQNVIFVNPTTGSRFVDESAERDVLSQGMLENGIEVNGTKGVFLEFSNGNTSVGFANNAADGRVYIVSSAEEIQEVLDEWGMTVTPEVLYATIRQYDEAYLADEVPSDGIAKSAWNTTIGTVTEDGEYKLEGETLRIRVMAPSTHHTMGGLVVDTDRHVLDADGNIIDGLYAAGEVTGGIHGGNRLGGNAVTEIIVSGRIAANTVKADAE